MKKNITLYIISHCLFCYQFVTAQTGKVGINTTTPQAMLHVKDSSVLFSGVNGSLPVSPGDPPASDAGVRMMWYPDKAAFRTGYVLSTNWNKDSIGDYSFGSGYNTKTKGNYSTAMGHVSTASGNYSTAMGSLSSASGNFSTAIGRQSTASADFSTAIGFATDATADYSTAMGRQSNASAESSTALGGFTTASGEYSTAMGRQSRASGSNSTSMGHRTHSKSYASLSIGQFNDSINTSNNTNWVSTDPVFIIGNGIDDANRSNAMTVLKNGNVGIGTTNPQDILHLAKASSGATSNSNASLILEDVGNNYIQFLGGTGAETGFLHGRPGSSIRGGIIFDAQSNIRLRTGGNNNRVIIDSIGNMGVDNLSPLVRMQINGGLALDNASATATSSNFLVTVDNRTYIRVSSNDVPANRFIELSNGLTVGQLLILECSASSGNGITVPDNPGSGNTRTAGNFAMTLGDTMTLIWNGDDWVELNRSDN